MKVTLVVAVSTATAALVGLVVTLATAAVTTAPALFLGAGVVAALLVWWAGCSLIGRWARPRTRRAVWLAGFAGAALWLAAVLVPLGDPVHPPQAPPGAGTWTLPDGDQLAYGVIPAAPEAPPTTPVVVLHGGPGVANLAGHLEALQPLADDGHDVWAYAQRGAGASSRLADPRRYTTELAVDDLEQVRRLIGADRMILFGHSYGSYLAAAYTAAYPDRVEGLIFSSPGDLHIAGTGGRPQERLDPAQMRQVYALVAPPRAMLAYALVQVNPAAAQAFASDRELDARQDRVYEAAASAMHCPGHQPPSLHGMGFYANQVPQSARRPAIPDVAGQVHGSPVPALVIKGQCDYLDWQSATGYLDAFPDSTLSYLTGAGHDAYVDQPERWIAVVRAFLAGEPIPGALADPWVPPGSFQQDD